MEYMPDDLPRPSIDQATGLCTSIMGSDFIEPLESTGEGCAMKTGSDAHKFCIFVWKCLNASESGSVGGDACRQFDILNSALDDTLAMTTVAAKFENLLGWTAAAYNHELHALLYRGDPDRTRSLFKAAVSHDIMYHISYIIYVWILHVTCISYVISHVSFII